ncbi:wnt family domain-containing protein [Ditylenchus destructor]|uniref:Protein Wnt n=1 Tax=Ditylenchus destructor TaxID=166010 RepID=A0AAD4R8P1_9BILA|nr:wnt family domain-containing protein [Ditylenchus destructor]
MANYDYYSEAGPSTSNQSEDGTQVFNLSKHEVLIFNGRNIRIDVERGVNSNNSSENTFKRKPSGIVRRTHFRRATLSHLLLLLSITAPLFSKVEATFPTNSPDGTVITRPAKLTQGCPAELFHLSRSFRHFPSMCRNHAPLAIVAYEGLHDAMEHCREQMRFQVWDCAIPGTVLNEPTLLRFGYRETAYLWAMSAAGAAWGVAQACAQGWLEECKCVTTPIPPPSEWEWAGCSYGVQYGVTTSRKLLTRSASAKSPLRRLEKHNLKAGRLAVKKTLISSCKCHGVSGSCQQRTCWKKTADLGSISRHLTEKYSRAKQVLNDFQKAKSSDLIYTEESPNSCSQLQYEVHQKRSLPRICNWRNETISRGSCATLCCGRGYSVSHEVVAYKCDCKFIWCCKLECNDCLQHRWVSTCNN